MAQQLLQELLHLQELSAGELTQAIKVGVSHAATPYESTQEEQQQADIGSIYKATNL